MQGIINLLECVSHIKKHSKIWAVRFGETVKICNKIKEKQGQH